jgi:hypothetical protein
LVKRGLRVVERRLARVRARDALLNVYAEHLSGIQKILSKAAQDMRAGEAEAGLSAL